MHRTVETGWNWVRHWKSGNRRRGREKNRTDLNPVSLIQPQTTNIVGLTMGDSSLT